MLGELRTSLLAPKTYFELHLRVTGELDGLARFFDARARRGAAAEFEARKAGRAAVANAAAAVNAGPPAPTSLAALYDLVQHAGNVLPRLYLLVTVGAARARASRRREEARRRRKKEEGSAAAAAASNDDDDIDDGPNEPAGAILADVAEMCRGVQHPVRGLFLRAFLLQATRDAIPRGEPGARFLLSNFAEANKLWVRLGYLTGGGGAGNTAAAAVESGSRSSSSSQLVNSLASVANTTAGAARAAREAERRQLADLVGKNITLLSQLEADEEEDEDGDAEGGGSGRESRVALYQRLVLPGLLEQLVGCRDAAAQAYLAQAIVQCFPDDHHVATLDALLAALPTLAPGARVAGVFGALLDRLARAAVERAAKDKAGGTSASNSSVHVLPADGAFGKLAEGAAAIAARAPDLPAADVASLYASLARYARALPPISSSDAASSSTPSSSSLPRVDAALAACRAALDARGGLPPGDRAAAAAVGALLCLPLEEGAAGGSGGGVEATLALPAFPALLASLPAAERRRVAARLAAAVVASERPISDAGSVATLLRFVAPLVRADGGEKEKGKEGEAGAGAAAAKDGGEPADGDDEEAFDEESFDEEQLLVARMIHRLRSDSDVDAHYAILGAASEALASGGAARSTRVLPPLAFSALDVAARAAAAGNRFGDEGGPRRAPAPPGEEGAEATARGALQFVSRVASSLADAGQAMAASAAAAEEGSRGRNGGGGGASSSSATMTSRKAAAAADAVTSALGIHLAAATLASSHPQLADDASDAFEQAFLLYEDACPPDSASQRGALRVLTSALAAAAAAAADGGGGLSSEALDSLAAKAASCASRLLRKADQCRALCVVAHVYWQQGGNGNGKSGNGASGKSCGNSGESNGDEKKPAPFRDASRALHCMQRALKAATAASAQAAVARRTARGRGGAVEAAALHVEVLDHYLRFAAAGAPGFAGDEGAGTLSALRELVAGEVVNSEEPSVRGDKELLSFYESTLQKEEEGGYGGGAEAGIRGLRL